MPNDAAAATPGATAPRIGVLSFAHYHANFWSEVFAARGVLAGVWDDDGARGREAAQRFGVACHDDLSASDLIGRYLVRASETVWQDGPLTRAVRAGAGLSSARGGCGARPGASGGGWRSAAPGDPPRHADPAAPAARRGE